MLKLFIIEHCSRHDNMIIPASATAVHGRWLINCHTTLLLIFFRRKKRSASETDTEDDDEMLPGDAIEPPDPTVIPGPEGLHPNDTWPTASGITQQMATSSCETPIRALPIFATCDEYTLESRQPIIQSCVLDIQVGLQGFHMLLLLLSLSSWLSTKTTTSSSSSSSSLHYYYYCCTRHGNSEQTS